MGVAAGFWVLSVQMKRRGSAEAVAVFKRVRGVRVCSRWLGGHARKREAQRGGGGRVRRRGERLCGGVKRATTRFEFPCLRRANGGAVDVLRRRSAARQSTAVTRR